VLVRGSNDIGSAVAHSLFRAGGEVAIHDNPSPTVTRRKMAFTDAIFNGNTKLEGVSAFLVNKNFLLRGMLVHHQPEVQLGLALLTIGLGPNFVAGVTTDWAVETGWSELGKIIQSGATRALQGEPKALGGHARDRYVYAPCSGVFHTTCQLGNPVEQGKIIARINTTMLRAPLTGILRGITHDNVPVTEKTKIIEVDPRGKGAQISGIAERPKKIAQSVLQIVKSWEYNHAD
jgi:xanthine dehydrogenase accessory factor